MFDNTYFQNFDNVTFSEVWSEPKTFLQDYKACGLPSTYTVEDGSVHYYVSDEDLILIWTLLIGRFADSTIKPYNTYGAFKIRFMSRIWQYAPSWKKELDIQNRLRAMSFEEGSQLFEGSKAIYNSAVNPGTAPSTNTSEELSYINAQNVTKYRKSKLEGLAVLTEMLKRDVTEKFLARFDDLFKNIIYTGRDLKYLTYEE